MARTRGISEKIVWLYNPCPKVSTEELLKRADLENQEASILSPFEIRWRYGGTGETEWVILNPGDLHGVRSSEAEEFNAEFKEQGMVVLPDRASADEARKLAIEGLKLGLRFWKDRGAKRAMEYRKKNALSREDMDEYRYDLWSYYLNEEKARACEAEIKRLQKGGVPVGFEEEVVEAPQTRTTKR